MIYELNCHPDTPARNVRAVKVEWTMTDAADVLLAFAVDGFDWLYLPEMTTSTRADELWRTTCFEMFWKPIGGTAYYEFNLSPSLQWAAYAFDGYRDGMMDLPLAIDPVIARMADGIEADVDLSTVPPGPAHIALTAVIEEIDGTKSYWSLAHPPGGPDFHHPDCFALKVPAGGSA